MTAEEIKRDLVDFARRWSLYSGSERSEAQTFLNELFACFGTNRLDSGASFEAEQRGRFLDLIWDRVCIIEMKRPSEAQRLSAHRTQALDYWRESADVARNVPAPRWVVLCAFLRFEVWEPGAFPNEPRASFDLLELPDQLDALLFLAADEPVFVGTQEVVTREAVGLMTDLYANLKDRRASPIDELRDFLLQSVWCMFAEDLGQIEGHLFQRLVEGLIEDPRRSSADDLGLLFEWLNSNETRPDGGLYSRTPYVNGGLFEHTTRVHLDQDELQVLLTACGYDWHRVEPHIFGSLLEGTLGPSDRDQLGAHYTHEADIEKVLRPTLVEPWERRIEAADSLREVHGLQQELLNFVVLDPACGSGNFLYLAYRALRRLEQALRQKEQRLREEGGAGAQGQAAFGAFFPLGNIKGIEINPFAVALARVTLWMGHKLAVDELELPEATIPLEDLGSIVVGDALRLEWPRASVVIGNPPFNGDRNLRRDLGDAYVQWLQDTFNCGIKDYCVYWFRKAHDHLGDGERAGLVGTNSISQNRARSASLNYIVNNDGVILDAVSSQPWPGEAVVEVSIVNWVKRPADGLSSLVLDGEEVDGIDTALKESTVPIADVPVLVQNRNRAFQGFLPGAHFDIPPDEAEGLLSIGEEYREVVKPYMDGRDITRTIDQRPRRWTVDFRQMSLEDAMAFPAALDVVREQAKEDREESTSYSRNPRWWQYLWPRPEFREAVSGLDRFIVGSATGKRVFWVWAEKDWRPSNSTNIVALDGDYAMAVLCSDLHIRWGIECSSTMRTDPRYTPSSAFDTFPWPQADEGARTAIAAAGRTLLACRGELCARYEVGLTALYNQFDEGAHENLRHAHRNLNRLVLDAYGWDRELMEEPRALNMALYEFNAEIVAGRDYSAF